jgi:tetratricopeptide (TPR) repeat protein
MLWLTRCIPHRLLIPLGCLVFLLCGCQPNTNTTGSSRTRQMPVTADSSADYGCSYFYFLWGRHAELLLRFEEALEFYQKALVCDEKAEMISEKVPILLLRLERTDEAAMWLHNYLAAHPEKTGMRMLYAKVLLRQNKNTEAMRQYQLISEQHPYDPPILLMLAEMYMATEKPEKAEPLLEQVFELDSSSYPGHILMARLRQIQGRIDEAVEQYQLALERNWSSELQMELGELYITNGRYDEAVALYKVLVERDEDNESARVALIHVYLLQGKDEQALVELNLLKSFVDQPRRIDLTIARLYANQKHYDKAIAIVEKILEKENLAEARYFLAVVLVQQEKYERALKQVRRIDRKAPEYPDALILQVRILREQNRLEEARQLLQEHIVSGTVRSPELYIMLAALHQLEGREDVSKKVLLQGLDFFPADENLLYEYGLMLEESGEQDAALVIMEKIIELKPDNAEALNFVGYKWAEKNINLDRALVYIQRAIALKPENGYIRDSLGWVYYRLGKIDQAIKELEAAVKLAPDDAGILEHLGDVYLESGRAREALQTYKEAVKLSKDEQEKKRILGKIRDLEKKDTH